MASTPVQLKTMLRKNWWLQKRSPCGMICNIILPVLCVLLAAMLMKLGFSITSTTPISSKIQPSAIPTFDLTDAYLRCSVENTTCFLGIVPDNEIQVPRLFEIINVTVSNMPNTLYTSGSVQVKYFATEKELENFYRQSNGLIWGAIVFTANGPDTLEYSIRLRSDLLPFATKTPCNPNFRPATYWGYSGFVTIQSAVEQALIQIHLPNTTKMPNINVQIGSYPQNTIDQVIACFIPLGASQILIYGFLALLIVPTNQLVREKQSKMKEFMKMAGLKEFVYWLSWLLTYTIPIALISLVGTLVFYFTLKDQLSSSLAPIFFLILLFGASITTFAFFIVSFVKSTKIASLIAVLWIIIPSQFTFLLREASIQIQIVTAFIAPLAFQMGFYKWGNFEFNHLPQVFFSSNDFSVGWGLLMLLVDSLIYLFLAWYISHILPGDFGVRKPAWFLFSRQFWCSESEEESLKNSEDYVLLLDQQEEVDPSCVEEVPSELKNNVGISIVNVTKIYQEPHDKSLIAAVKNFSLDIYTGQILALLGHNGAGKTTLVSILTGMISPTLGNAYIYGRSIKTHMDQIRKTISFCPQHDLLFDDLTGREHLQIFGELKGVPSHLLTQSINVVAHEVDLSDKLHTLVKQYSGGMKRKLCLAISLLGDSRVLFLDEPTSGLDPVSRRNVWNLLKTKKENRIIILTTHYMEEADALGDRIAIMGNGRLKCCGSSLFLKNRFGTGYYMNLTLTPHADKAKIIELLKSHIPRLTIKNEADSELSVLLPLSEVKSFSRMFLDIEKEIQRQELGIRSYGISMTTLEDVFLAISHEDHQPNRHYTVSKEKETNSNIGINKGSFGNYYESESVPISFDAISQNQDIESDPLQYKPASRWRQFRTLVKKRFIELRRSWILTLGFLLLPSLFLSVMLGINYLTNNANENPQKELPTTYLNFTEFLPLVVPFNIGPMIDDPFLGLWTQFSAYNNSLRFLEFPNSTSLIDFILGDNTGVSSDIIQQSVYGSIQFHTLSYNTDYSYDVLYNNSHINSLPIFINLMNRAIYGNLTSMNSSLILRVASHPLPSLPGNLNQTPSVGNDQVLLLWATVAIVFSFAFLGGLISKQIVVDKEYQLRLQFSLFGVNSFVYWFSNFIVDVVMLVVAFLLLVGVAALWRLPAFVSFVSLPALIVLGLEFVVALIVMDYIISFIFKKSESSLKWIVLLNLSTVVVVLILTVVVASVDRTSTNAMTFVIDYAPLVFPTSTFAYGVFTIQYAFQPLFGPQQNVTSEVVWSWDEKGIHFPQKLFSLFIHTIVFFAILFVIDYQLLKLRRWVRSSRNVPSNMFIELEDSDVKAERDRLRNNPHCNDMIKAIDLSKNFGNIQAVNGITLGVAKNQCFGLLGPNGAGKSTTIAMLTGQLSPSTGDVFLDSISLYGINLQKLYRRVRLGYCLQSNQALSPYLTVREHLEMYTNLRNELSTTTVKRVVQQILTRLDLEPYANRLAKNLSGGNKRKLSVAIALLVGNQILCLDEPSTGMDPSARRAMWSVIKSNSTMKDRCILLTTHSMEEAENVCGRIGIVVKGKLRCLGSNQHLKEKFGTGYRLSLSFKEEHTYQVLEFVQRLFPNANILETMEGSRTFDVGPIKELSTVFDQIEQQKDVVGITNYSLSQTSLEQIFLHLSKQQEY